jgi:Leucine-rich repeat (LRR) protein
MKSKFTNRVHHAMVLVCLSLVALSCKKTQHDGESLSKDTSEAILAEQIAAATVVLQSVHGPLVDVSQHIKMENNRIVAFILGPSETERIPEGLGKLKDLKTLKLSNTNVRQLPNDVYGLMSVESLYIDVNKIDSLPDVIEGLKSLCFLSVYSNGLKKLSHSIGNLMFLKEIDLGVNALESLPESICNLRALRVLAIEENDITHLPDSIGKCINLEHLEAQGNKISSLPGSFIQLKNLRFLSLNRNAFSNIPKVLDDLPLLKTLGIGGKIPFTEKMIPPKLYKRNKQYDIDLILG